MRSFVRDTGGGQPVAVTAEGEHARCISPEGLTFLVLKNGQYFLRRVDGGDTRPVDTPAPVRWSADGRAFYARNSGEPQIYRVDALTGYKAPWRTLTPPEPGALLRGQVVISADGQAWACSYQRDVSSLYLVKGVR